MIHHDLIRRPARCSPRTSAPVLPITYAGPLPPRVPPQYEAQSTRSYPAPLNPYPLPNTSCPCHVGTRPNLGAVGTPCLHAGTKLPCTGAMTAGFSSRTGDRGGPCMPRSSPAYEPGPGGPVPVRQKRDNCPSPGPPPPPPPPTPCQCGCSACGERCAVVRPSVRQNCEKPAGFVSFPPPPAATFNLGPGQMGPTFGGWNDGGPVRRGRPRSENPYLDPQLKDILDFRRRVLDEQMACSGAQHYEMYQPPILYYYNACPPEY